METHGKKTSFVNDHESCFKFLHAWRCKSPHIDHMSELENALKHAGKDDLVDEIKKFSKANSMIDPEKICMPRKQVTQPDITLLIKEIGSKYRPLLRFLDIPQNTIEQTEEMHADAERRIFHLLNPLLPKLTRQDLCNALNYIEKKNVIDKLNAEWGK